MDGEDLEQPRVADMEQGAVRSLSWQIELRELGSQVIKGT